MDKCYTVYRHTSPSGKVYIGVTGRRPDERWGLNGNGYKNGIFWKAVKKYGWENIGHEILSEGLTKNEAIAEEVRLIAAYQSNHRNKGYNITDGGEGASGFKHSAEAKRKIGAAAKGNTHGAGYRWTAEQKARLIGRRKPAYVPREVSEETRKRISEANRGRECLASTKQKISISNSIPVNQYGLDGTYIATFPGANAAARALSHTERHHIAAACSGKRLSWCGFQWRKDTVKNRGNITPVDIGVKTGDNHPRAKAVTQFALDMSEIARYETVTEARKITGVSNIHGCCSGKLKQAGGYIWRYAEKE